MLVTAISSPDILFPTEADGPVGVFDSGIGGLSVLQHIRSCLPHEHVVYFADSGFAPYGDKPDETIVARSLEIADFLMQRGAKTLVVACNTATAAAIHALRARYPVLPLIGVEPGLKPAAEQTTTKIVGVMATYSTLSSTKFRLLLEQMTAATGVQFLLRPCIGLADQVEKGEIHSPATVALVQRYVEPLIRQGADTLVLGCTHYPFLQSLIREAAATPITLIDTGKPVARQLVRLLTQRELQRSAETPGTTEAFTTGSTRALASAFSSLLNLEPSITRIAR